MDSVRWCFLWESLHCKSDTLRSPNWPKNWHLKSNIEWHRLVVFPLWFERSLKQNQDPSLYEFPSRGQGNNAPLLLILDRAGVVVVLLCFCVSDFVCFERRSGHSSVDAMDVSSDGARADRDIQQQSFVAKGFDSLFLCPFFDFLFAGEAKRKSAWAYFVDISGTHEARVLEILLKTQDSFYRDNMNKNFGELGVAIKSLVEEFQKKTTNNQNIGTLEDIRRFIQDFPEFRKLSANVSKHVTLMTELSQVRERRKKERERRCLIRHWRAWNFAGVF